jgi:poly(hydroxyalkanoate) depolymerase family esterase
MSARVSNGLAGFLMLGLLISLIFSVVRPIPAYAAGSFTKYDYGSNFYFKVYVPSGYKAGTAVPLMVMLHGCTQNADDFAAGTQMNALAEEKKFIVLYPEMSNTDNANRCWNWFDDSNQHRGSGEPAIIKGMVDWVKSRYSINSNKVYVAGLSAGAAMSVIMGVTYPDVFKGVGVGAGLEYDSANSLIDGLAAMKLGGPDPDMQGKAAYNEMGIYKRRIPVIVFHGTSDMTVDQVNASQVIGQWAQTNDLADDGSDNDSVDSNADQTITGAVTNGRSYTRFIYNDKKGRSVMEKWMVNGMGHAWSGGSASGSYTDPSGPNATRIMWDFFVSH